MCRKELSIVRGQSWSKVQGKRRSARQPGEESTLGGSIFPSKPHDGLISTDVLPGHSVKLADAIQAYIQAKLKGPLCWVELPTDAWPPEIQYWKFRRPVVRLDKALYGHPDSGTMWEQHCDKKVQEIGFKPIGEEWPSMYFHDELKLLLVIYVDDLKLAGPSENLAKGWEMLRTVLRIEPETDLGLYLGCVLSPR